MKKLASMVVMSLMMLGFHQSALAADNTSIKTERSSSAPVAVSLAESNMQVLDSLTRSEQPIAISFTHYYDLCAVLAKVSSNTSLNDSSILYHFAYSIYGG